MQKVITINLNGNAYQVDEGGYSALLTYLDGAQRQLADNPDRVEIIADLEQAIADKCGAFLGPHKTVVTSPEVDQIIREMGPVETANGTTAGGGAPPAGAAAPPSSSRSGPRRLYRIREDAVVMGVCSGIGAYVGIDPIFVRILFLILIVSSAGIGLIGYWILAVIIPEASTPDERAAAHGQSPLNARDLIDQAKAQYAGFAAGSDWRRRWREDHRAWRRQRRAARWGSPWVWGSSTWNPPPADGAYASRVVTGAMIPLLSLVSLLLFAAWAFAVYSLVTSGQILGTALPDDVPSWVAIIGLVVAYQAIAWPLHFARRRAAFYSLGGPHYSLMAAWDGLLSLTLGIFAVWVAYHYIPQIREVIRVVPDVLNSFTR